MSAVFSNKIMAHLAVTMAICLGGATYLYVGLAPADAEPRLSPIPAGAVSYSVAAVIFYAVFGLLAMHWFGWRYWVIAAAWGLAWLMAFYLLGNEWPKLIGLAFTFLTVLMIGILLPEGGLTVPGEQWKNRRHR